MEKKFERMMLTRDLNAAKTDRLLVSVTLHVYAIDSRLDFEGVKKLHQGLEAEVTHLETELKKLEESP